MRVSVFYVFPNVAPDRYEPMARRFVKKYMEHPPGKMDHELFVIANGSIKVTPQQESLFSPLSPNFIYHNNYGKDIGAYMFAASHVPCDLMVCVGAPVRPHLDGWLDTMVRAVEDNGPGVYGQWASHAPRHHIRTTCFWIQPQLLMGYPNPITNFNRYQFEHGPESIALWCLKKGYNALQVTGRGVFAEKDWQHVDPGDSLMFDQICDVEGFKD